MIKSKKRYNKKKNFLTKKNLIGGNPVDIPLLVNPYLSIDLSGVPIQEQAEQPNVESQSSFDLLKKNKYITDTIRFFENEKEDICEGSEGSEGSGENKDKKINYLLNVYQYIVNNSKNFYRTFFTKNIENVCVKIDESVTKSLYLTPKVNPEDKFIFYTPRLHGKHDKKSCGINQLPENVYLCFYAKFNNYGMQLEDNIDIFKFFQNIDKGTFTSIKNNLSLYGLNYEFSNLQNQPFNYSECFRSASWYYPNQYY